MKSENFFYTAGKGWSVSEFPALDSESTLVMIIGGAHYLENADALQALYQAYPSSHFVGCSSAGEIYQSTLQDDSITVAVIKFDKTNLKVSEIAIDDAGESFEAGAKLAKELNSADLKGILVFSDGLSVNGTDLVKGLHSELAENIIVTGGLAGDGDRFQKTWILSQHKKLLTNHIAAVGLYGDDVVIRYGSQGGWDTFGPERTITRSVGNVVYEIDDEPALALYKKYLGEKAKELPASALLFPLSIRETEDSVVKVVRTILSVDEKENSMTFAGDVPIGWCAQLMTTNFERLIEGASSAGELAKEALNKEVFSLAVSCVGRRLVLGERTEEEIEAILDVLPEGSKQIGYYSYGEISPTGMRNCELHNQTMTVTNIFER